MPCYFSRIKSSALHVRGLGGQGEGELQVKGYTLFLFDLK